jgi:hypothetical protein
LEPLRLEGTTFETGECFVAYNCSPTLDVAVILHRHAREEYEPGMLVEVWGGRIASYWSDGEQVLVVETCTFTAPGWSGPMTHVEAISQERYREHADQIARGEFAPMRDFTKS